MKLIKNYIQGFLQRKGSYIFFATVGSRVLSFLASWLALQFIENKELGVVLFAYSIVAFLIPIGGFGLHQSLIRYGALLTSKTEKNSLFVYVFKKGILVSILLISILIIVAHYIPFQFQKTAYYLTLLSLLILPTFVFEIIRTQFRLNHNNKLFAYTEITHSAILVICVCILSFLYKEIGYIIALVSTPLFACLLFLKYLNIDFSVKEKKSIVDFSFWKYGFYAGLTSVVTNLLFIIDILLIGKLLSNSEMVTIYKYLTLIPFSVLLLPRVFIATDFVTFTKNINDKKYIFKYIKSYLLLFSIVSICMCIFFCLFSKEVLILFDKSFMQYTDSFVILIFGICGILIFRNLFGNLLCSIGKIEINYYIISIALVINVLSNYYLIPIYGIKGAAITSATLMWFTGIFSCIWFLYLYHKMFKQ